VVDAPGFLAPVPVPSTPPPHPTGCRWFGRGGRGLGRCYRQHRYIRHLTFIPTAGPFAHTYTPTAERTTPVIQTLPAPYPTPGLPGNELQSILHYPTRVCDWRAWTLPYRCRIHTPHNTVPRSRNSPPSRAPSRRYIHYRTMDIPTLHLSLWVGLPGSHHGTAGDRRGGGITTPAVSQVIEFPRHATYLTPFVPYRWCGRTDTIPCTLRTTSFCPFT